MGVAGDASGARHATAKMYGCNLSIRSPICSRCSRAAPACATSRARRPRPCPPVRSDPARRAPRRSRARRRRARARHRRHRLSRRPHRSRPARRRARRAAARPAGRAARRRARDREALPRHHRSRVPPPAEPRGAWRRSPLQGDALADADLAALAPTPTSTAILDLRRADERAKDPDALVAGLESWRPLLSEVAPDEELAVVRPASSTPTTRPAAVFRSAERSPTAVERAHRAAADAHRRARRRHRVSSRCRSPSAATRCSASTCRRR